MNLLLLLSALLSALTGVAGTVRVPVAQAVASRSAVRARPVVRQVRTVRPVAALPGLDVVASALPAKVIAPLSIEPLWASRRRE